MIKFNNVSKSFGENTVIDDLSFEIKKGERVCIKGESGSGKTTLLRLICGFEKQDKGSIELEGGISVVFQENRLFEGFTALENVRAVCTDDKTAEDILAKMGLGEASHKKITELSGGMARRVAMARALAYPHDILILDEPFTGIDEARKNSIIEEILGNIEGKTLILVSHDETECRALCEREIIIK